MTEEAVEEAEVVMGMELVAAVLVALVEQQEEVMRQMEVREWGERAGPISRRDRAFTLTPLPAAGVGAAPLFWLRLKEYSFQVRPTGGTARPRFSGIS